MNSNVKKSIAFVYFKNPIDSEGIELKISNFSNAFIKKGFYVLKKPVKVEDGLIKSTKNLFSVVRLKTSYIFIRYNNSRNVLFLFLFMLLRLKKRRIIIEVPTPIINNQNEITISKASLIRKVYLYLTTVILGPIPFAFGHLVIQYAEEGRYYKLLTKNSILIGNGIDSDYYTPSVELLKPNITEQYEIVVIANLAPWHGIDLLLNALKKFKPNFKLHIIGDGVEKNNLLNITKHLKLTEQVVFYGKLNRTEYLPIIQNAHLGVGSLNWKLIGVTISSALKLREYVSSGLQVIYSSRDVDLDGEDYCYQVQPNCESILESLNKAYEDFHEFNPINQVLLAKNKLDMNNKVDQILNHLDV